MPGPRERTYRGYLLRENPWLQLQGMQHVCVGRANKSRLRCARQLSDKRKFDPERRPAVIPIFGPYQSIVRFDNGARDGQPMPMPSALPGSRQWGHSLPYRPWRSQRLYGSMHAQEMKVVMRGADKEDRAAAA